MHTDTLALYKCHCFIEDLHYARHDFGKHVLKLALTNDEPKCAMKRMAEIKEIKAGNGYPVGGYPARVVSAKQTDGQFVLQLADVVIKAAGGEIAEFQHAVLYNASAPDKPMIGFYCFDDPVRLKDGDKNTLRLKDGVYAIDWCDED